MKKVARQCARPKSANTISLTKLEIQDAIILLMQTQFICKLCFRDRQRIMNCLDFSVIRIRYSSQQLVLMSGFGLLQVLSLGLLP